MSTIISSFFTRFGVPELGLSPIIRIWEVTETTQALIADNEALDEIDDGFYRYVFTTFDPLKNYVMRVFGGNTLPQAERYHFAASGDVGYTPDEIATGVWDKKKIDHVDVTTMGGAQNQTFANSEQLVLEHVDLEALLLTLLKYQRNRTKIDKIAKTLTVYDDDGTSILQVFNLKDGTGAPNIEEVCERDPI